MVVHAQVVQGLMQLSQVPAGPPSASKSSKSEEKASPAATMRSSRQNAAQVAAPDDVHSSALQGPGDTAATEGHAWSHQTQQLLQQQHMLLARQPMPVSNAAQAQHDCKAGNADQHQPRSDGTLRRSDQVSYDCRYVLLPMQHPHPPGSPRGGN